MMEIGDELTIDESGDLKRSVGWSINHQVSVCQNLLLV